MVKFYKETFKYAYKTRFLSLFLFLVSILAGILMFRENLMASGWAFVAALHMYLVMMSEYISYRQDKLIEDQHELIEKQFGMLKEKMLEEKE